MESVESGGAVMLEVKGPRLYFRRTLLNADPSALSLACLMPGGIFLFFNSLWRVAASWVAVVRVGSLVMRSL